jgi:methyl-accepting chemotaxis protein
MSSAPEVHVLRRLTIGTKLRFSFLLLALASAVVGTFGLLVTGSLTDGIRDLTWNRLPAQQALGIAHEGVTRMRALTSDGLVAALRRDEQALAAAWRGRESARGRAAQGLAKFGEAAMTADEEALWKGVDPSFQAYVVGSGDVWQLLRAHDPGGAAAMLGTLTARADEDLVAPLEKLEDLEAKIGDGLMIKADETASGARRALWTVLLLTFAAAALMVVFLPRGVTRPVRALSEVALRIADGDLTPEVVIEAEDEVGAMAASFQRMVVRLRELVSTLRAASQELAGAAALLSETTRAQTSMLERQAAGVAETTTTTRELEQTSAVAAGRAAAVLEVARRAAEMSESGRGAAARSLEELQRIQGTMEGFLGHSATLLSQARQVDEVVATVSDLAAQSHVLSLNASIEAARAGVAGRGFAVVAQEVRALAEQSGAGAERIGRAVRGIQAAVEASRAATEEGTRGMADSLERIRSSGESLREIGGIVRETGDAAAQIASAVQQQSTGVAQIAEAMRDLDKGMEETVGRVRSLEQSAEQVAETAARIADIAGQFRV